MYGDAVDHAVFGVDTGARYLRAVACVGEAGGKPEGQESRARPSREAGEPGAFEGLGENRGRNRFGGRGRLFDVFGIFRKRAFTSTGFSYERAERLIEFLLRTFLPTSVLERGATVSHVVGGRRPHRRRTAVGVAQVDRSLPVVHGSRAVVDVDRRAHEAVGPVAGVFRHRHLEAAGRGRIRNLTGRRPRDFGFGVTAVHFQREAFTEEGGLRAGRRDRGGIRSGAAVVKERRVSGRGRRRRFPERTGLGRDRHRQNVLARECFFHDLRRATRCGPDARCGCSRRFLYGRDGRQGVRVEVAALGGFGRGFPKTRGCDRPGSSQRRANSYRSIGSGFRPR